MQVAVNLPTQAVRNHCEIHYSSKSDCKTCPYSVKTICHGGPTGLITAEGINRHIAAMDRAVSLLTDPGF